MPGQLLQDVRLRCPRLRHADLADVLVSCTAQWVREADGVEIPRVAAKRWRRCILLSDDSGPAVGEPLVEVAPYLQGGHRGMAGEGGGGEGGGDGGGEKVGVLARRSSETVRLRAPKQTATRSRDGRTGLLRHIKAIYYGFTTISLVS